jgi:hypothetical protein
MRTSSDTTGSHKGRSANWATKPAIVKVIKKNTIRCERINLAEEKLMSTYKVFLITAKTIMNKNCYRNINGRESYILQKGAKL